MRYPRLRMCWAKDDAATAALFLALKRGRPDPDAAEARGAADAADAAGGRNQAAEALLLRLPGVGPRNVRALVDGVPSLAALADLREEALAPLVGPQNARKLYAFLRRPLAAAGQGGVK